MMCPIGTGFAGIVAHFVKSTRWGAAFRPGSLLKVRAMSASPSPLATPWLTPREPRSSVKLALGTMNFGDRTSEADAERIMARAVDLGILLFDTANMYNDGESERIVGRAVRKRR